MRLHKNTHSKKALKLAIRRFNKRYNGRKIKEKNNMVKCSTVNKITNSETIKFDFYKS